MASFAFCRVEGHGHYSSLVDANCRQNSADPESVDQPLLARHALRDFSRPGHFAHTARYAHVRDTLRFHRSPTAHSHKRWQKPNNRTGTAFGCRVLSDCHEDAQGAWSTGDNSYDAERNRKLDSVRTG